MKFSISVSDLKPVRKKDVAFHQLKLSCYLNFIVYINETFKFYVYTRRERFATLMCTLSRKDFHFEILNFRNIVGQNLFTVEIYSQEFYSLNKKPLLF